jgi:hypothetical protein
MSMALKLDQNEEFFTLINNAEIKDAKSEL